MPPDLKVYCNLESCDCEWVQRQLRASYWGGHYTIASLFGAMENSVNFSAVIGRGVQIGYARVVTDRHLLSHLTDVIVDEEWRRQGVATAMLERVFAHPWVKNTLCICQTRHHYALYQKFGFVMGGDVLKRNPG